jgi:hypothetical protein
MCCSFNVIQGARVEISMDANNFTPHGIKVVKWDLTILIYISGHKVVVVIIIIIVVVSVTVVIFYMIHLIYFL